MSTKLVAAFLDRVQRSGLISESKLSQLRQELETQGVDLDDPTAVAAALVDRGVLTQWQTEKLLQGKHKGFFLGSYRLLRPLGKGGMGAVFLAQHEMMRRQCAIKVLPQTQIDKHSSVLERFYVEAQAVASLDHQNIVRAYDVSKEVKDNKEIHYLVMEYVEGQDAQIMVQESGPLDYVKAAEIIRQTANGLAHAHEHGLVHRDIKPANLLIDKKGVVKVLDLGLARFHDDSGAASLTAAHNETVLGTADYLSPEQALNSHNVDQRTDLYSLGCTAYFLLTGHPPFPDGSVAQRLVAHQVKQPKAIAEERHDAPPELTAIISKMMAKNPDERYENAAEVATALAAWLVQYGGEDWRRQHSEITGDSSVLNLLPQHREPTRAFSSAFSETELELAPLDEEADDISAASPAPAKKGSSANRSGKSGRVAKASDDVDLSLADDEPSRRPDRERPPASGAAAAASPPADLLETLPSLEAPEPLATPDLLADLPAEDPLASLDQVDLVGPSESGTSLGALDSHIRTAPGRGPSSSARLSAAKKAAEPAPKTLKQNLRAIGMPILVGVVGGLLLVLIIILFVTYSPGSSGTKGQGPGGSPFVAETIAPEPAADATSDSAPSVGAEEAAVPEEATTSDDPATPAPPEAEMTPEPKSLAEAPQTPEAGDFQALAALDTPPQPAAEQRTVAEAEPAESPEDLAASEPGRTVPGDSDSPATAREERSSTGAPPPSAEAPPSATQPEVETPEPPVALSRAAKDELLGAVTEFAVEIEFQLASSDAKPPKQLVPILEEFRQTIGGTLEQMVAVKAVGLQIVKESDQAVMDVTVRPSVVTPELVFLVSARLRCRAGQEWVEVWDKPEAELVRFRPQAMSPSQVSQLRRIWGDSVREFFQDFRTKRITSHKSFGS
jgi:serine/threonine protein kinase